MLALKSGFSPAIQDLWLSEVIDNQMNVIIATPRSLIDPESWTQYEIDCLMDSGYWEYGNSLIAPY